MTAGNRVLHALKVAVGLLAVSLTACTAVPANAPAREVDPPRFLTILAALKSDRAKAATDVASEATDIKFGAAHQPSQRCYILFNDVRYDVKQRLDHDERLNTSQDAASLQKQFDATWQELVHLQQYNQDFSNNGVAPFGGAWATAAIDAMMKKMRATAGAANRAIAAVNSDVAEGYKKYHSAWKRWNCQPSKLLHGRPVHVAKVTVKKLPKPTDP
jgi:hypothetical protein